MTQGVEMLPVEQSDRDAVQAFHRLRLNKLMEAIKDEKAGARLGEDEGDAGDLLQAFARHRLNTHPAATGSVRECAAKPDHDDIMATIENAADDWQKQGYTSALAEVRDMANVGRSLMEALPKGYCYMDCPSEIVSDLQNQLDEALAAVTTPDAAASANTCPFCTGASEYQGSPEDAFCERHLRLYRKAGAA